MNVTEQIKKELKIQRPMVFKGEESGTFIYYSSEVWINGLPQKVIFKVPVGCIVSEDITANLLTQWIVPVFKRTKLDGFFDFCKRTWFITKAITHALGYLIKMTLKGRL